MVDFLIQVDTVAAAVAEVDVAVVVVATEVATVVGVDMVVDAVAVVDAGSPSTSTVYSPWPSIRVLRTFSSSFYHPTYSTGRSVFFRLHTSLPNPLEVSCLVFPFIHSAFSWATYI